MCLIHDCFIFQKVLDSLWLELLESGSPYNVVDVLLVFEFLEILVLFLVSDFVGLFKRCVRQRLYVIYVLTSMM